MKLNYLIVLTIVLSAFCVFPVNAANTFDVNIDLELNSWNDETVITLPDDTLEFGFSAYGVAYQQYLFQPFEVYLTNSQYGGEIFCPAAPPAPPNDNIVYGASYVPYLGIGTFEVTYYGTVNNIDRQLTFRYTVTHEILENDIIIEEEENIINLGDISDLNQRFTIGSNQNGEIILYNSYTGINCTIVQLEPNYIDVRLDENFKIARINLLGDVEYENVPDSFNTHALIYYNYTKPELPTNLITAYIQTFDYQSGNMVSSVNMSVYEVIDHDTYAELGQMIYSSINAESQTILQLKNNTEYFVKNELTGYYAVKNENYPYFNNIIGYWWNPSLNNPLILYYSRLDPSAQYNANFIVQDVNNNGISGVSVTMDNTITKVSNSIGGLSFSNVSAGSHTFTFVKNGYQSAQRTINIQMQYATFTQTLFKDNQIIQPTLQPTGYPTIQPTLQPTITPIDKPANIADSVKYGLSKMFGVNSLDTINLVFALMLILFPAVIGGVITNQALGFIAGGMMGFVFALAIGLIPIWVFFAMVMFSVIYLILTHGTGEGF